MPAGFISPPHETYIIFVFLMHYFFLSELRKFIHLLGGAGRKEEPRPARAYNFLIARTSWSRCSRDN